MTVKNNKAIDLTAARKVAFEYIDQKIWKKTREFLSTKKDGVPIYRENPFPTGWCLYDFSTEGEKVNLSKPEVQRITTNLINLKKHVQFLSKQELKDFVSKFSAFLQEYENIKYATGFLGRFEWGGSMHSVLRAAQKALSDLDKHQDKVGSWDTLGIHAPEKVLETSPNKVLGRDAKGNHFNSYIGRQCFR